MFYQHGFSECDGYRLVALHVAKLLTVSINFGEAMQKETESRKFLLVVAIALNTGVLILYLVFFFATLSFHHHFINFRPHYIEGVLIFVFVIATLLTQLVLWKIEGEK